MRQATNGATQRLLQLPQVLALAKVSSRTIDRLEEAGLFPKRVKFGKKVRGWPEDEVLKALNGAGVGEEAVDDVPPIVADAWRALQAAKQHAEETRERYRAVESAIRDAHDAIAAPAAYADRLTALRESGRQVVSDLLADKATKADLVAIRQEVADAEEHAKLLADGARTAGERLPELESDLVIAAGAEQNAVNVIVPGAEITLVKAIAAHFQTCWMEADRAAADADRMVRAAQEIELGMVARLEPDASSLAYGRNPIAAWMIAPRYLHAQPDIERARERLRAYLAALDAALAPMPDEDTLDIAHEATPQ